MKKIKAIICELLSVVLLLLFAGCSQTENSVDDYETSQTTNETTEQTTESTTSESYTNDYSEETEVNYYHAAIEGCVIENQDGTEEVHYCEKCEACGYVSSSTHTMWHSFGAYSSSFHCPQCGNMQQVSIETTQN